MVQCSNYIYVCANFLHVPTFEKYYLEKNQLALRVMTGMSNHILIDSINRISQKKTAGICT